jgi:hypothetical protein
MKAIAHYLFPMVIALGAVATQAQAQNSSMLEDNEDLRFNVLQAKIDILLKQYQTELNNLLACQEYAGFWDGSKCHQISCVRPNSPRGNSGVCIDGNGVYHYNNSCGGSQGNRSTSRDTGEGGAGQASRAASGQKSF